MNFNLKKFLKTIKLNESEISMFLGALVIIVTGILIVNYFKDKKGEAAIDLAAKNTTASEHIVLKGETLWSISEDTFGSGYNWVDIYEANNLKSQKLEVGQKLVIPTISAKEPTSTKQVSVVNSTSTPSPVSNDKYTVIKGDSLWTVAVKEYGDGYKWVAIAKANKLTRPNVIHPGNTLILPR